MHQQEEKSMKTSVVVLGAGFGGLELTTILSDALGDALDITLIDKGDAFVFGFSKLDVMFGRHVPAAVRHAYGDIVKPGVRFLQSTIRSINPTARRTVTDAGTFEADVLVVALGADYDMAATPGLVEGGHEFYTVAGAFALPEVLARFERGPAIIGVCGKSFKCPPAPRTPWGDRDFRGDALRDADSAVARHLARNPRRIRGARHQVREGQPGEGA
jgi:sulfide:quinone oxidoreductase